MVDLKMQRRNRLPSLIPYVPSLGTRMEDLPSIMRRFLSDDFPVAGLPQPVSWLPAMEVTESDKEMVLTAELPGMSEKDIDISVDDDVLTISGEKLEERKEEKDNKRYHVWERNYGSFRRSFTLPGNVDASKAAAAFKDGVLTIRIPVMAERKPSGRKIPIGNSR